MKQPGGLTRYTLPRVTRQNLVCSRLCSALDAIANDGSRTNKRFSRPSRVEIQTFSVYHACWSPAGRYPTVKWNILVYNAEEQLAQNSLSTRDKTCICSFHTTKIGKRQLIRRPRTKLHRLLANFFTMSLLPTKFRRILRWLEFNIVCQELGRTRQNTNSQLATPADLEYDSEDDKLRCLRSLSSLDVGFPGATEWCFQLKTIAQLFPNVDNWIDSEYIGKFSKRILVMLQAFAVIFQIGWSRQLRARVNE